MHWEVELAREVLARFQGGVYIVGIAGIPGIGKVHFT